MSKRKKIVLTILALVLTAGYIAGMSYIVEQMRTPSIPEPLSFGDYYVIDANGKSMKRMRKVHYITVSIRYCNTVMIRS